MNELKALPALGAQESCIVLFCTVTDGPRTWPDFGWEGDVLSTLEMPDSYGRVQSMAMPYQLALQGFVIAFGELCTV